MPTLTPSTMGSCRLSPVVLGFGGDVFKSERASTPSYCCTSDYTNVRFARQSKFKSYHHLSSSGCFCRTVGSYQERTRLARVQAVSLQAITADNESSGSDAVRSSAQAMDTSSDWQGREDVRQLLMEFWQGLQEGLRNLKDKGIIASANEAYRERFVQSKDIDAKWLFVDVPSQVQEQSLKIWQSSKPWVKWPFIIVFSSFSAVIVVGGVSASIDLMPLWIFGTVGTSCLIRTGFWIASSTRELAISASPYQKAFVQMNIQLYEDIKTKQLSGKVERAVKLKKAAAEQLVANKRSELLEYVRSGQAAVDASSVLEQALRRLWDWCIEKYENYLDWWRPFWRAFSRLMKKLF